ncbi:MAG: chromosomal replication initiator protein DnaA [Clostridiales bacterium]|nr:MAG: chromosomal replication initiator protein DnaA [Clostridiales bacterium]
MGTKNNFKKLKSQLEKSNDSVTYNTWYKSLTVINEDENTIYLLTSSEMNKKILINRKTPEMLQNLYYNITGISKNFAILSDEDIEGIEMKDFVKKETVSNFETASFNPKYTFEDFVVGEYNRFAHATCLAVAENPGKSFNPLFLYGGVGLGKTHLMQAIGHFIKKNNPSYKILYTTSEKFTNDFINSIKSNKLEKFRDFYRNNVDILLIDDIHFLIDKERTQEEFFHTFNDLYQENKQIVITSDKPPNELNTLESRLSSRFNSGLTVDIKPPDYETRIAILKKKAENENNEVSNDVFEFIAKNIKSNIRELEGALTRIFAYSNLVGSEINIDTCKEALKEIIESNKERKIDYNYIREVVCSHFSITELEIDSPIRTKQFAYPRQIAMYLIRKYTNLSFPKIGEIFGNRDHSTVVHACDKMEKEIKKEGITFNDINRIKEKLKA